MSGKILIKDNSNVTSSIRWTGNEVLHITYKWPPDSEGQGQYVFYVYAVEPIESPNSAAGRFFELSFASSELLTENWNDNHLQDDFEFMGSIDEFVGMLTTNFSPVVEIEPTGNKIWYRPQYANYPALRKDGPQKKLDLLHQLAENSIHRENLNAANFLFYQTLEQGGKWNFKSVEELFKQEPRKTFSKSVNIPTTEINPEDKIETVDAHKRINLLDLAQTGAFSSTYEYFRPRIDESKASIWFTTNSRKFYYKVNCKYRDRFPAAIIGWEQIEEGKAQWRYAFVEVYLQFDFEEKRPIFRVKPQDQNPIRSNAIFKKQEDLDGDGFIGEGEGPYEIVWESEDEDINTWFEKPAFNLIEIGNDGFFEFDETENPGREDGFEAPGINLSSKAWEDGCYRIQPIRGSFPKGYDLKGPITIEDQENPESEDGSYFFIEDDMDITGLVPVVDMKIYWDDGTPEELEEGEEPIREGGYQPHYFFSASNVVDGECDTYEDAEQNEICRDEVEEETEE